MNLVACRNERDGSALKSFAVVAAGEFEQREKVGHFEDVANLLVGVIQADLAAAGSGGDVEGGDGAEAGAIDHGDFFHVDENGFVVGDERADFVTK